VRKIVIHSRGGYDRLQLETHPDPVPGPGEVRIDVAHIGVNYADCVIRMGLYASAQQLVGWPITPGFEVAGMVDALGAGVDDLKVGDGVLGLTLFNGYSSSLVVPRAQVFPIPRGLDSAQAAGIPTVFLTAWFALHELAHVRKGERVLIHSAAGGVGSAAVQLAAHAGAQVTAVVGSAHKRDLPKQLGAQHVIDKSAAPLWDAARKVAPDGYDVVLDANGVSTLAGSYAHLAPLGRLLVYGFHSMMPKRGGRPNWLKLARDYLRTPRFNPLQLTTDNRSVLAFNLSFVSRRTDLLVPAMEKILAGFGEGWLRSLPVKRYPLAEVARAHADLESGQTVGKLVLEINGAGDD
jgi:NADPH:quinone reductase-like Zn-dependent oxidoreductase